MKLEEIWSIFLDQLQKHHSIQSISKNVYSGTPFIYIQSNDMDLQSVQQLIKEAAVNAMVGKRLHCETVFVREEPDLFVFRHRFYVPQEKMFCCGNLCDDCIRLR